MTTVHFMHIRNSENPVKGGKTIAYTLVDNNRAVLFNVACCCPNDNFCRRTGRLISEGRLLKAKDNRLLVLPFADDSNFFNNLHHFLSTEI